MYYVYLYKRKGQQTYAYVTDSISGFGMVDPGTRFYAFTKESTARNFATYLNSQSGQLFVRTHQYEDLAHLAHSLQYAASRTPF